MALKKPSDFFENRNINELIQDVEKISQESMNSESEEEVFSSFGGGDIRPSTGLVYPR